MFFFYLFIYFFFLKKTLAGGCQSISWLQNTLNHEILTKILHVQLETLIMPFQGDTCFNPEVVS